MSVEPLDFQQFVGTTADEQRWQICNAILEGGGGGTVQNSNVAVESDGVTRAPLNLDSNGRLIVDIGSSIQIDSVLVDLSTIEGDLTTLNALTTTQVADISAIESNQPAINADGGALAHITNFPATQPVSAASLPLPSGAATASNQTASQGTVAAGSAPTNTTVTGAVYQSTAPTLTSGQTAALQADSSGNLKVNLAAGSSVPTGTAGSPNSAVLTVQGITGGTTIPVTASAGDLTSGNQTTKIVNGSNTLAVDSTGALTANNAVSQVYNYTATGTVATNTVVIGPFSCGQFREVDIQVNSIGTGTTPTAQISNDNVNWVNAQLLRSDGAIATNGAMALSGYIFSFQLFNAQYFRVYLNGPQTAGTTTLVASASQQATPKLYQSVAISSGTVNNTPYQSNQYGFSNYHTLVAAATTNATLVKNGSGTIGTLILTNNSSSWAYFKLCNSTSAPTPGTTTAVINIGVAPNSSLDCSASFAGLRMPTGIAYYVSAGTSLTDNTALAAAGTFLVNMTYV